MIGLDTNVLVRYLVQDDPVQGSAAASIIEGRCTPENPGRVDHVVLCELVWVLETAYGYSRPLGHRSIPPSPDRGAAIEAARHDGSN